ncbi:MAG TPA: hypothetical protein DCQ04_10125, partial [Actinobacteria bacterium]|nr:hypothetical protein [Actinomycetota bacterium]
CSRVRRLIERDGLIYQICFGPMLDGDFTLAHIVHKGVSGSNEIHNLRRDNPAVTMDGPRFFAELGSAFGVGACGGLESSGVVVEKIIDTRRSQRAMLHSPTQQCFGVAYTDPQLPTVARSTLP